MIIKLKAGLGNMMFQYAMGRNLQLNYGIKDIKFDTSYYQHSNYSRYLDNFVKLDVRYEQASRKELDGILSLAKFGNPRPYTLRYRVKTFMEKTINRKYFYEPNRGFIDPSSLVSRAYLDGYWQSWKYVAGIFKELKADFSLKQEFSATYEETKRRIAECNAVALCIRKGDYLSTRHTKSHFFSCTASYYLAAIDYVAEKVPDPVFYLFTNDIEWFKSNLKLRPDVKVIIRDKGEIFPDYAELQLMASCKHAIISNSTFHWWGAWLIDNEEKQVIAPHKWFADRKPIDVIPPEWIKIDGEGEIVP